MSTLIDALLRNAGRHGDRPAILEEHTVRTWREHVDRVARIATLLGREGVGSGDRFAILMLNSAAQAELIQAGQWIGAVPVPVNFRLAPVEIRRVLDDAGCRRIACGANFADLMETPDLSPWRGRGLPHGEQDDFNRRLESLPAADPCAAQPGDMALLLYTGGTSGRAKGVPLTHANIIANGRQVGQRWKAVPDDVVLHVPPMFHSAELVMTVYLLAGAANAYLPAFSPQRLLQAIQDYRATFVLLVPTMITMTLDSGLARAHDTSSLRQLIYGASPMPVSGIRRLLDSFPGIEVAQGYGLTETAPLLTMLDHAAHLEALASGDESRLGSCGRVLPGVQLRVVDGNGADCATGEAGEIVVRGDNVFAGYLDRPDLDREAFVDGWFRTGDVGLMDAGGYLYLKDRKHDMILSGGEKVYSGEVEQVLAAHPAVAEAAVIGIADDTYGESVAAVIVTKPGAVPDAEALIDFCRGHIGGFKLPRRIEFVEQLPKSALGKVLKTELRRRFASAIGSSVGATE